MVSDFGATHPYTLPPPPPGASDSGAARICQQGAKARERSDQLSGGGCGGIAYTNPYTPLLRERSDQAGEGVYGGREIFENSGMKTTFLCTLNAITWGKIIMKYSMPYTNPYPPY